MLFCGDLSIPNLECSKKLSESMDKIGLFKDQTVIMNLEGVLLDEQPEESFWKVYNHKSAIELRNHCRQLIFGLANNHMYDYPNKIKQMTTMLDNAGIQYFGLISDSKILPLEFEDNGELYAIFGHCWAIYTRTNPNKVTNDRVVDCSYEEFYKTVTTYMVDNPHRKVIVYFHWNFDFEEYPQPAYKKLAHDLIDFGVEAVIGNHAHCMQEMELYRGKPIAYGEGNFYIPGGYFFNGSLSYPEKSHSMYIVSVNSGLTEMKRGGGEAYLFSTDTGGTEAISLKSHETVDTVATNAVLHVVGDNDLVDYKKFFQNNRVKRKFVPVFDTYYDGAINKIKTVFCIAKINAIRSMKMFVDKRKE